LLCVVFKHLCVKQQVFILCHYATFLRLRRECHIQNLLEQTSRSGPNLINIGWNLTFFGQVQSVDLLGWGSMSLGCSQQLLKKVGVHVLRVISKITHTSGGPILVLGVAFSSLSHLVRISLPSRSLLTFDM
jgi:hypothetical protein